MYNSSKFWLQIGSFIGGGDVSNDRIINAVVCSFPSFDVPVHQNKNFSTCNINCFAVGSFCSVLGLVTMGPPSSTQTG